jgi:hypothetical protein
MRFQALAGLFLASVLLFVTGAPAVLAQYDQGGVYIERRDSRRYQERSSPYYGGPSGYYGGPSRYQPAPRSQPAPRGPVQPQYGTRYQAPSSSFFFPWFGTPEPAPSPAYRPERRRERVEPREVRRPPRAAPDSTEKPAPPAVEPSTFVVTFGDSLADLVGNGLDDVFEENLDVEIVRKTRSDSGLVRNEHYDWPKTIQEFFDSGQKISFAVIMLGSNDRQAIREGEVSHDPLSDRWRELYRERVDAVVRAFAERRVPLVWIGLPPMRNDRLSADFMTLNEIYRERVQRAGGVYVDIWEAFVNDEGRYAPVGPDVAGPIVRLRASDGVHFTRAGARKAAHFVDVELKRLFEARAPSVAVTPPVDPAPGASADPTLNAALPKAAEPQGPRPPAPRPIAGPVLPLTRVDVSPGGTLTSGKLRLEPETAHVVERTLRDGVAPPPKSGRADDFSWPKP